MIWWYDDVARSGRCAYMLGLSVKLCYMAEGTLFSHFIQLPSLSSSSSVSHLLLHPLPLLLIFHFIVFHFSLSSSIPSFSLCLLYSCSLLFFPVLSFLSYLSLIFLFIILFFGNPLPTLILLWSSFSFSSSSDDLSSSIPITVFFIILIS